MNNKLICQGCGTLKQNKDKDKEGFIVDLNQDLCKRCFDLKHYNKISDIKNKIPEKKIYTILSELITKDSNLYLVIDIFNLEFKIQRLKEYIDGKKFSNIFVVINKFDILPKSLKFHKIDKYVRGVLDSINYDGLIYVSALKNLNHELIANKIVDAKQKNNYFIGYANSGKSLIITKILKSLGVESKILVSEIPGTTLGKIDVKYKDKSIIDLPGFYNKDSYTNYLSKADIELINIKSEIKQINYSLHSNEVIFIDKNLILNSWSSTEKKINYQFFFSNRIGYHKTKINNIDKNKNNIKFKMETENELISSDIKIPNDNNNYDIVVCDFGRIRTIGLGQKIKIWTIKNTKPIITKSFIS